MKISTKTLVILSEFNFLALIPHKTALNMRQGCLAVYLPDPSKRIRFSRKVINKITSNCMASVINAGNLQIFAYLLPHT